MLPWQQELLACRLAQLLFMSALSAGAASAAVATTEGDEQLLEHALLANLRWLLRHTLQHNRIGDQVRGLAAPSHEKRGYVLLCAYVGGRE